MMDPNEFAQRMKLLGGGTLEPFVAETSLAEVTLQFEGLTNRYWKFRTGCSMLWYPELYDQFLWFYGVPVINDSTLVITHWNRYDGPTLATTLNPLGYTINYNNGQIFKVRDFHWNEVVQANYSCGLQQNQIPEDVKKALVIQAQYSRSRFSATKIDLKSHSTKGSSAQLMEGPYHPIFQEAARQNRRCVYGNLGEQGEL